MNKPSIKLEIINIGQNHFKSSYNNVINVKENNLIKLNETIPNIAAIFDKFTVTSTIGELEFGIPFEMINDHLNLPDEYNGKLYKNLNVYTLSNYNANFKLEITER